MGPLASPEKKKPKSDSKKDEGSKLSHDLPHVVHGYSLLTELDIHLFNEGRHFKLYEKLGAHPMKLHGVSGTYFAVWAPNAEMVTVIGDFNGWSHNSHPLGVRWDSSGIWEGFIPHVEKGDIYKYCIITKGDHQHLEKCDPFAFQAEIPPRTASVVAEIGHKWSDNAWMKNRGRKNALDKPISVYELHVGSWRRKADDYNRCLTYRELADELIPYIKDMGFTHVEFMPVSFHPFYGSWGYQTTGYFAPASWYGEPEDLMYLIDQLHQNDIGVYLDWVPAHFPNDEHALANFDGTCLYEHHDPQKGFHPDWKSCIFNYGRHEVKSFLISSAAFWLDQYHADGLRVDGVASMLYLDYSRDHGEWVPNEHGGRENLEAIQFLKELNAEVYGSFPDVQMIAEESTAWPGVSRPTDTGGLGFGLKWNMGWMHDTLCYFQRDCVHRKYHVDDLTFGLLYAFHENFMLSLSHDEVVHGKAALLSKMPGDNWQKYANLRCLYGQMYAHPGKKLLFMGAEIAPWDEWQHDQSLDWHLLQWAPHQGVQQWVKDLNRVYKNEPALYADDFTPNGFEWVDCSDREKSVVIYKRKTFNPDDDVLVVCNFTPSPHSHYRVGVDQQGYWQELLNSDAVPYGGSGMGNLGGVHTQDDSHNGRPFSLELTLPPLSILYFKRKK